MRSDALLYTRKTAPHQLRWQELVKLLVEKGADVNMRNKQGQTALAIAREKGFFHFSKYPINNATTTQTELYRNHALNFSR